MTDPVEAYRPDFAPRDLFPILRDEVRWGEGLRRKIYMTVGDRILNDRSTVLHPAVSEIVALLNKEGPSYDTICLNYYTNGTAALGWHCDDWPEIDQAHPVAIVSFGGVRQFEVRHQKTQEVRSYLLQPRSLLLMPPGFHQVFDHRVPPMEGAPPRISLMMTRAA